MAKNDRDRLIQTFLARNRRKPPSVGYKPQKGKPPGLQGYRPMPTGGQDAKFSRSRRPPRYPAGEVGPPIPGYGQVQRKKIEEANARWQDQQDARGDRSRNPRSQFGHRQRAPYRGRRPRVSYD